MYDLPGGILLYVRFTGRNLTLCTSSSEESFSGGILLCALVLRRNINLGKSSL